MPGLRVWHDAPRCTSGGAHQPAGTPLEEPERSSHECQDAAEGVGIDFGDSRRGCVDPDAHRRNRICPRRSAIAFLGAEVADPRGSLCRRLGEPAIGVPLVGFPQGGISIAEHNPVIRVCLGRERAGEEIDLLGADGRRGRELICPPLTRPTSERQSGVPETKGGQNHATRKEGTG